MSNFNVYRFLDKDSKIIYVGKTASLESRLYSHFKGKAHLPKECYEMTQTVEIITLKSKAEMDIKELFYINVYKPQFNKRSKDSAKLTIEFTETDPWVPYDINHLRNRKDKAVKVTTSFKNIRLNLKNIMSERNITQMELSEMTGIRQATISDLVNNKGTQMYLPNLEKICYVLSITDISEIVYLE